MSSTFLSEPTLFSLPPSLRFLTCCLFLFFSFDSFCTPASPAVSNSIQTRLNLLSFHRFKSTTENPTGPTVCRTDSSMGNQIVSYQKSQPSYSFGSRTDAESIFGLPKPKTPRRVHYRKTNMYKEDHTLGYDPYIKRDPSLAISTSSVSSLRATASKDVLSHIPSRRKRHMKSKKGGGSISKTFVKQYKAVHKLSRPKHGAKILPTVGGYYPEHYAAMEKMTGESYYS